MMVILIEGEKGTMLEVRGLGAKGWEVGFLGVFW